MATTNTPIGYGPPRWVIYDGTADRKTQSAPDGSNAGIAVAALAASVALIQAILAAVGAANGGLETAALNEKTSVYIGFSGVVVGLLLAVACFEFGHHRILRRVLLALSAIAICIGLLGTAYAAVAAPATRSQPSVSASVTPGNPTLLRVSVTATGVPRGDTYRLVIYGELRGNSRTLAFEPAPWPYLYESGLGADAKGNINTAVTIEVPARKYIAVGIHAFIERNGKEGAGHCFPTSQGGHPIEGCAYVSLI